MIKSFILNSLLIPLRQVSPQMLLASATLHGLLLVAPISSNSTDVNAKDTPNVSEAGTDGKLLNQDSSLTQPGIGDSLKQGDLVQVPGEPPLLSDLENGSNEDNTNPDLADTELDGSVDQTPTSDFSSGGDNISSSPEFPTTGSDNISSSPDFPTVGSDDLSLNQPNSEPQIAFRTEQPVNEPEPEPTNTVSEPEQIAQSEPTNTVSEPEQIVKSESIDSTTEAQPEETSSKPNNTTTESPVNPFADFPNYNNVRPIFCGVKIARLDRRTRLTSDSLDTVVAYFEKRLAETDFQVEKLTDEPDTKVYQVSKENLTQFLQLFATQEPGTMILLSSERVDCYRLSNQNLQEKPNAEEKAFDLIFSNLYIQLDWTEEKDFAVTPEVEKVLGKDIKNTPDELALLIKSNLESEGFETSQIKNNQTSELVYEVKKGEFIKYISFVPTKEGKGAIVLLLKNNPS
ncbi:MAG: hypothetical protein VKN72_10380 [Nostocales cyanobacterium 94392]|nr:hypothetical protein [Nostocales cyanobacterium 94392]